MIEIIKISSFVGTPFAIRHSPFAIRHSPFAIRDTKATSGGDRRQDRLPRTAVSWADADRVASEYRGISIVA
ncbi:MAG TPA: hypothetical protein VMV54_01660 [Acidocella sp.]|nr:hypothetical protein [Acidocella sp.]